MRHDLVAHTSLHPHLHHGQAAAADLGMAYGVQREGGRRGGVKGGRSATGEEVRSEEGSRGAVVGRKGFKTFSADEERVSRVSVLTRKEFQGVQC